MLRVEPDLKVWECNHWFRPDARTRLDKITARERELGDAILHPPAPGQAPGPPNPIGMVFGASGPGRTLACGPCHPASNMRAWFEWHRHVYYCRTAPVGVCRPHTPAEARFVAEANVRRYEEETGRVLYRVWMDERIDAVLFRYAESIGAGAVTLGGLGASVAGPIGALAGVIIGAIGGAVYAALGDVTRIAEARTAIKRTLDRLLPEERYLVLAETRHVYARLLTYLQTADPRAYQAVGIAGMDGLQPSTVPGWSNPRQNIPEQWIAPFKCSPDLYEHLSGISAWLQVLTTERVTLSTYLLTVPPVLSSGCVPELNPEDGGTTQDKETNALVAAYLWACCYGPFAYGRTTGSSSDGRIGQGFFGGASMAKTLEHAAPRWPATDDQGLQFAWIQSAISSSILPVVSNFSWRTMGPAIPGCAVIDEKNRAMLANGQLQDADGRIDPRPLIHQPISSTIRYIVNAYGIADWGDVPLPLHTCERLARHYDELARQIAPRR